MLVKLAQNRFKRFHSRNFDVKSEFCSGHPVTEKPDDIFEKVELDRYIEIHFMNMII